MTVLRRLNACVTPVADGRSHSISEYGFNLGQKNTRPEIRAGTIGLSRNVLGD
jgi:hypothetical protein